MIEEESNLVKYNQECWDIQNFLGKKYFTTNSRFRWINVYKKILGIPIPFIKVADVYAIDEEGYGDIVVHKKYVYDLFKKYVIKKGYPKIEKDFFNGKP